MHVLPLTLSPHRQLQWQIAQTMMENPPDMAKLAIDVQKKCPKEASEDGVTIMLGKFHNFCEAIKIDRTEIEFDDEVDLVEFPEFPSFPPTPTHPTQYPTQV